MKPIDLRNETWDAIRARMVPMRMIVYRAWLNCGPGTTRQVASDAHIDILTFRPRTTELYELGFVELVQDAALARRSGISEGVYRAVSWDDAKKRFEEKRRGALTFQPELQLGRLARPEAGN